MEGETETIRRKPRKGRRRLAVVLFCLLLVVLLLGVSTLLCRVKEISTGGMEQYDAAYISRITGVDTGDNLLFLNTASLQTQLLNTTLDADAVTVTRTLPSTLSVEWTAATATMSLKLSTGTYVTLSQGMRVMETGALAPTSGTIVLHGFTLADESVQVGDFASFATGGDLLSQINAAISACGMTGISAIDISDTSNIKMLYGSSLVLELGDSTELDYKIGFIQDCMDKGRIDALAVGSADAGETGKIYYHTVADDATISTTIDELTAAADTAYAEEVAAAQAAAEAEAAAAAEAEEAEESEETEEDMPTEADPIPDPVTPEE